MERITLIVRNLRFQEYLKRIEKAEQNRKFCCHNWQHYIDVARISYIMILEKGDSAYREIFGPGVADRDQVKELVYAAALLHDIGRWIQYETGEDHALASSKLARDILHGAGFDNSEIEVICKAISEHRRVDDKNSCLGNILARADDYARSCSNCLETEECYKYSKMETAKKPVIY